MSLQPRQLRTLRVIECDLADSDPYLNAYFRSFAGGPERRDAPGGAHPARGRSALGRRRGRTRGGAVKDRTAGNRPDP